MWKQTRLTELLGIELPIIQAGMAGGITTPELVAAVSNAGGLGSLGAGYMDPDEMQTVIKSIKQKTHKPFAVNVFVPGKISSTSTQIDASNKLLQPYLKELGIQESSGEIKHVFEQQLEKIIEEHVQVCSFTFGLPPKEWINKLKANDIKLIGTATTVEEAILNEEAGMDAIVAQGYEAGGHRGTFNGSFQKSMIGTMSLVPQVVDKVSIPVVAAGGIMDARGLLASMMLGAQGIQMGTAFVTSKESSAKHQHKQAILTSSEDATVMTSAFSGKTARGIDNLFIKDMAPYEHSLPDYPIQNSLTKEIRKTAAIQQKPQYMSLWSGQSPRLSREDRAEDILSAMVTEADSILTSYSPPF
ncbi:NAD(P)H-dependent flavin oxidoreductase [Halobacillus naozhouensis]|uniref:Probable nitronate monooxygenase n=1 Tax=Halobacillus naozhouensis TaxID=554880 RepID=A0ABY8IYZ0_9BACI|nr:nitronate monooxygenase [Halobacillus naozhouensis]WFT73760.1 nitronate monooxygenase [Halobacillus naozhouensis]